jgi:hypothetical protein
MESDEPARPRRRPIEIRRDREAEALRANLRKRKDQRRAREAPGDGQPPATPPRDDPETA